MNVRIEQSWQKLLGEEFEKPYFKFLVEFLKQEYKRGVVYPIGRNIFRAFDLCPINSVKVVILGQDPYHGRGQANGLSFAVNDGIALPPSLKNIFKELSADLKSPIRTNGDLSDWASQGVLLLNATLTVEAGLAGSHQNKGWEEFTDKVIRVVSEKENEIVFVLWGAFAQKKELLIDTHKHLIIKSAHPSPFSADRGFFGSKPFSKINEYLLKKNKPPIKWLTD